MFGMRTPGCWPRLRSGTPPGFDLPRSVRTDTASLQGVPTELYEAATMDGANAMQRFFSITVPMISPVIFYNVTLGVIGAFQYFVPALLIGGRNGNPQGSLLFFPLHFYRQAFVFSDMGYASVLALVIFVITMISTGALFFLGQRLVYYAGGEA